MEHFRATDAESVSLLAQYFESEPVYSDTSLAQLVLAEEAATAAATAVIDAEVKPAPELKNDVEVAPAVAVPETRNPGPWFDMSPYDAKQSIREIGTMIRAFEDTLWNHAADLNSIEANSLMGVIHCMRATLTNVESAILVPRVSQQKWMPSLGLATGMKACFQQLLGVHRRLRHTPGSREVCKIVHSAGEQFAAIMKKQEEEIALVVGINLLEEQKNTSASAATTTTTAAAAAANQTPTPPPPPPSSSSTTLSDKPKASGRSRRFRRQK